MISNKSSTKNHWNHVQKEENKGYYVGIEGSSWKGTTTIKKKPKMSYLEFTKIKMIKTRIITNYQTRRLYVDDLVQPFGKYSNVDRLECWTFYWKMPQTTCRIYASYLFSTYSNNFTVKKGFWRMWFYLCSYYFIIYTLQKLKKRFKTKSLMNSKTFSLCSVHFTLSGPYFLLLVNLLKGL